MPGLFGILAKHQFFAECEIKTMACRMADSMRSRPWQKAELLCEEGFCGGRVHLGVLNPEQQPLGEHELTLWFDGEVYLASEPSGITPSIEDLRRWIHDDGRELAEVDGVFAMACYNAENHELTLVNDRLGFRPLYYTETKDWFAYSSEVKALLAILPQIPDVDEISLRQFFGFGYMLGHRTWWKSIWLLPPASLWRVSQGNVDRQVYWTFDDIKREPQPEEDVLDEFRTLWSQSVHQRSKTGVMPLLLSGGLDSRLLLAELKAQNADVVAITFGDRHSTDMQIAQQCAAIAGVPHRELWITPENWWQRREEAIWYTDGLVNARDLHAAIAMDVMHVGARYSPMNVAGDLLFGGSYLSESIPLDWKTQPVALMENKYLRNPFFDLEEVLAASKSDLGLDLSGPSSDCFYLRQRVRRITLAGPLCTMPYCEAAYPSLSYPLLKLMLGSLDDKTRMHSKFYNRYLLSNYPRYFRNIPWQKTGRGMQETPGVRLWRGGKERIKRRWLHLWGHSASPYYSSFVNYPDLVHRSKTIENLFPQHLLADEILGGAGERFVANYQPSDLAVFALIGLLTFETYLRQVTGSYSI